MDFNTFDGRFDPEQDGVAHSVREVIGEVTDKQALIIAQSIVDKLEAMRRDLARAYGSVPGGTPIEHEIGETLTQIRKSIKRTREAVAKLAQQKLPLDD